MGGVTTGLAERRGARAGGAARRVVALLVSLVRLVVGVIAAILVADIVLTVGSANPANPITIFFRQAASGLTLGLSDLFLLADPRLAVLVNEGIAAVVWLVIGAIVVRILRAAAGRR